MLLTRTPNRWMIVFLVLMDSIVSRDQIQLIVLKATIALRGPRRLINFLALEVSISIL